MPTEVTVVTKGGAPRSIHGVRDGNKVPCALVSVSGQNKIKLISAHASVDRHHRVKT